MCLTVNIEYGVSTKLIMAVKTTASTGVLGLFDSEIRIRWHILCITHNVVAACRIAVILWRYITIHFSRHNVFVTD